MSTEPQPFAVIEVREADRVRVQLRGELDLDTAGVLAERLRALRERRAAVLLDLEQLEFMDAAGLRVILAAAHGARNDGWVFTVTRGSAQVRRLFDLLGIETYLMFDGGSP